MAAGKGEVMKDTFEDIMNFCPGNRSAYDGIKKNIFKLVPFVGAGLTAFVYGTWNELLSSLSEVITDQVKKDMLKEIADNCYGTAEFLEKERSAFIFEQDLMRHFSEEKLTAKTDQLKDEAIWLLPELFHELVITTNFDTVLEYVYRSRDQEFKAVIGPEDHELLFTTLREKTPAVLFKLHGTLRDELVDFSKVVLSAGQYQRHYSEDSELRRSLTTCFKNKLLLFLGCSLQQDRTMELLKDILKPGIKNYAIVSCEKENLDTRIKQLGELQIQAVFYEGDHHESVRIILEQLITDLQQEGENRADRKERRMSGSVKYPEKLTGAPAGNPDIYKGSRKKLEERVIEHIRNGENTLLYGSGGIGKTAVAQEIYRIVATDSVSTYGVRSIAWVTYGSDLAVSIYNSVFGKKGKDIVSFASEWLAGHSNMLLFIDNVDDEMAYKHDQLFRSLSNYPVTAVVTGRIMDDTFFMTEEVGPLSINACRKLFYFYYRDCEHDDEILDQILETLSYHTVTVELTARIASIEEISLRELRSRLEDNGLKFSDEPVGSMTYTRLQDEKRLIEQLKVIFSIAACGEKERRLLGQMAVIPQQAVTGKQICEWFDCQHAVIEAAVKKGWISRTEYPSRLYSMNSIVSQAILDQADMEEVYASCSNFAGLLIDKLYVKKHRNDSDLEKYLSMGRSVLSICHEQMHRRKDMQLLVNFLNAYTYIGAYHEILELQDIVKEILLRSADNSVLSANLECILGVACQRVAQFHRAVEHYKRALNICRYCSDYKSSELYWAELILENNIATARHRCGNFREADDLYRRLEEKCADFLERKKDRRVETLLADCMNNHGALLSECGDKSAVTYCLSALRKNLTFLADDKDDRAYINTNIYINLALCAADEDTEYIDKMIRENTDMESSFALLERALRKRKYTENKLALATAEHNLAVFFYLMKNDLRTALSYTREALSIRERYYGNMHPSAMSSRINLGTFLLLYGKGSGRSEEGIQIYRDIVNDLKELSEEERSNIRQIPRSIYSNIKLFPDSKVQREILGNVSVYCKEEIEGNAVKQLHEPYGSGRCCSGTWNFIITREVSNITIANKL